MKIISFILAIVTLSLSMYPCDDELFVSSVGETAITNHDHDGHNHEDGEDFCSPFCACAISNVQELPSNSINEPVMSVFQTLNFLYIAPRTSESTRNVFQPPKA